MFWGRQVRPQRSVSTMFRGPWTGRKNAKLLCWRATTRSCFGVDKYVHNEASQQCFGVDIMYGSSVGRAFVPKTGFKHYIHRGFAFFRPVHRHHTYVICTMTAGLCRLVPWPFLGFPGFRSHFASLTCRSHVGHM